MKLVCTEDVKINALKFRKTSLEYSILGSLDGYEEICIDLEKNKIYNITPLSSSYKFNGFIYEYEIEIENEKYFITKAKYNNYFRKPKSEHYKVQVFATVEYMNQFLEKNYTDDIKDIKFYSDRYMVIYKVKGEIDKK